MAETTVKVGGDSREAVRELRQVGRAAADVGVSLKSMAGQAALTGLAVVGLDNVVAVLQRTVEEARIATEAYLQVNASAAREARGAAVALNSLRVAAADAALGGGNAELIFSNLSVAMQRVTEIINENDAALREFTREGVAFVIEGLGLLIESVGQARIVFVELRAAVQASIEGLLLLDSTIRTVATGGLTEIYRRLNDLEGPLDRFLRRSGEISGELDIGRGVAGAFADETGRVAQVTANFARALREGRSAVGEQILTVNELIDRYAVLRGLFGGGQDAPPSGLSGGSGGSGDDDEAKRERQQEIEREAESLRITIEGLQAKGAAKLAAEEAEEMRLAEKRELRKQRDQELADNLIRIEEHLAQKRSEIAQREADEAAALLQERQDMAREYASSIGGLIAELAGGQRKALDVIKQFIGQELIAKGQSFLLEAAAMAFIPGKQPLAAGLIAASVAMIAAGAKLSKTGGGARSTSAASAGTAPLPQAAQATEQRTVTTQVNFGVVGDPRAAAQMVADMNRRAIREGYTAGAA